MDRRCEGYACDGSFFAVVSNELMMELRQNVHPIVEKDGERSDIAVKYIRME